MNMKEVSIIIVSFNTCDLTLNCIESIYKSEIQFSFEIIVVDNASKDESVLKINNNWPEIVIIENSENLLFAKANNQGAKIATGKYLLLLNSDTIVQKGEIDKLVSFLNESPDNIACVGPNVLNEDMTFQSQGFALPSLFERFSIAFKIYRFLPSSISSIFLPKGIPGVRFDNHEVGWISGCCMLIRRLSYLEVGGLNEELQFYGEEPEFGWRMNLRGYKTWVISDSSIIHLGGKSTNTFHADFLKDIEGILYRYSQLQKYTVGYKKSIKMSQVVLIASMIKKALSISRIRKQQFSNEIEFEKIVINYLKTKLKESKIIEIH